MSDERSSSEETVEDLDLTPDDAEGVKGGDDAAAKKKPRTNVSDIKFTHTYDKSSPIL